MQGATLVSKYSVLDEAVFSEFLCSTTSGDESLYGETQKTHAAASFALKPRLLYALCVLHDVRVPKHLIDLNGTQIQFYNVFCHR